jgi:type IV pilus assembly protein PilW
MGLIFMKNIYQKGFTLVEIMIALLLSGLVIAGMTTAFRSQQETYTAEQEVAEMQQELRAGIELMTRELRNAGHDMSPLKTVGAGFVAAGPYQVQFTMDITGTPVTGDPDGDIVDPNEDVTFGLMATPPAAGIDLDGIADAGVINLGRDTGGGLQALVSNIHAVGFAYALDINPVDGLIDTKVVGANNPVVWYVPDGAGNWIDLDTSGDGVIDAADPAPAAVGLALAPQLGQIRAVRIWMLARASRPDPKYTDSNIYKVGANVINDVANGVNVIPPVEVNFRRRLLTANLRCRNMGIPVAP